MKSDKWKLILIIANLAAFSCCKERVCRSFEDVRSIEFHNYRVSDVDTIIIETFSVQGEDTIIRNETQFQVESSGYRNTELKIFLDTPLNKLMEYKIIIPATHQTFILNGFVIEEDRCRGGCGPNYDYEYLREFELNNQKFYGSYIDVVNTHK